MTDGHWRGWIIKMTMILFKMLHLVRLPALALLTLLALTACGGGAAGNSTSSSAVSYEIRITAHARDNPNLGGDLRKAESIDVAVFEKGSNGVEDNCVYLSSDKQTYESDPFSWIVSPASAATLSASEACSVTLIATQSGVFTLTAINKRRNVSRTISVDPALLTSISVSPASSSVYKGLTRSFTAIGHYSDSSEVDLTGEVRWAAVAVDPADTVLAVFSETTPGLLTAQEQGALEVSAALDNDLGNSIVGTEAFTVTEAAVTSLTIESSLIAPLGRVLELAVAAIYTDDSSANVADEVTWHVADESIVSMDANGYFTALQEGSTEVYVTRDNNYGETITSNTMQVTVEPRLLDSLTLAPVSSAIDALAPVIAIDKTAAFTVTGTYSTGEEEDFTGSADVTLASSDASIATFASTDGQALVTTLTVGVVQLSASRLDRRGDTVTGTLALTVNQPILTSIEISSPLGSNEVFAKGDSVRLTAIGHYSDESTRDISSRVGIEWASADSGLAAFNNGSGSPVVTGTGIGSVSVTASMINTDNIRITSEALTLTISPPVVRSVRLDSVSSGQLDGVLSLPQGISHTLQLTGIYSDLSEAALPAVSWISSNTALATVDDNGVVLASKLDGQLGNLQIAAAVTIDGTDFNDQISLTVTEPILLSLAVTLDGDSGFWKGRQQAFVARGSFSNDAVEDLSQLVSWAVRADDLNRVTLSANQLQLNAEGDVRLTATYTDAANADQQTITAYPFTVKPALLDQIAVTAVNRFGLAISEIANGRQQQFTATGTYSDLTTQDLTTSVEWSSSLPANMSIVSSGSSGGLASARVATSDTDDLRIAAALTNAAGNRISGDMGFVVAASALESIYLRWPDSAVYGGDIPAGASEQIEVRGLYSDGIERAVPAALLEWSSSDTGVATVGQYTGRVTAVADQTPPGNVTITAVERITDNGFQASLALTSATAIFESIRLVPDTTDAPWQLAEGGQQQFQAVAEFTDGSERNITADTATGSVTETVWEVPDVSHQAVISVDNRSGYKGLVTGQSSKVDQENILQVSKVNSRGWIITATARVVVGAPTLAAIEIKPNSVNLVAGDSQALTASGIYTDNTQVDLTSAVIWSSPRQDVLQFSSGQSGLAQAMGAGTSLVSATMPAGSGQAAVSGYRQINVEAKALRSLAVTPTVARFSSTGDQNPLFLLGLGDQLTATGTYSDTSTADLTSHVVWSSLDTSVATVSSTGLLVPVVVGTTVITATQAIVELGISKTISVSYNLDVGPALLQSIELEPQSPVIAASTRVQFRAWGRYSDGSRADITQLVTWTSGLKAGEDPAVKVGIISNATDGSGAGVFVGQFEGQIAVSARVDNVDGDAVTASTLVTVKALTGLQLELDQTSLYKGQSATLRAYGLLSDGSRTLFDDGISWSNTTPATLLLDQLSDSSEITVNALAAGAASVDATRTLTDNSVVSGSWSQTIQAPLLDSISLAIDVATVPVGMTRQLTATGHYSDESTADLTTSVSWSSLDSSRATMAADGTLSSFTEGTVQVRASLVNAEQQTVTSPALTVTVQPKALKTLALTPASPTVAWGRQQQMTVSGVYSDDSLATSVTSGLVWQSSDTSVATVDANGLVTTLSSGQTSIEARIVDALLTGSGAIDIYASTLLTVSAPVLNDVAISSFPGTLAAGQSRQLGVEGTLSDGNSAGSQTVTSVSWFSSNSSVAAISNQGLLTAKTPGQTRIQISRVLDNGVLVVDEQLLTVTEKVLEAISFGPASGTLAAGRQLQLTAVGTYSDGSIDSPMQQGFVWQSSNSSAAQVSPNGLVTARGVDVDTPVSITAAATASGVTVTPASLTVQPALLAQLLIAGNGSSIPEGTTYTFSVTGIDTLGDTLTSAQVGAVQWSSSDSSIASIDASTGVLTAINAGRVTVLAQQQVGDTTVAASVDVLIGDAVLSSIAVYADDDTAAVSVPLGLQHSFHAVGTYSDGSTINHLGTGFSWTLGTATGSAAGVIDANGQLTLSSGAVGNTLAVTVTPSLTGVSVTPATVTVAAAELVQMTIQENGEVIPVCLDGFINCSTDGFTRTLTLTGLGSDGNSTTPSGVIWSVSDSRIAAIDAISGEILGLAAGSVEVTAEQVFSDRTVVATATVLVGDAELQSIEILSAAGEASIEAGVGLQHPLQVKGVYSNLAEVEDLGGIQWSVTSTEASNSAAVNQDGVLSVYAGVSGTTLTVTATHSASGKTADATVTLTDAEPVALTLLETDASLALNTDLTLTLQLQDSAGQTCRITNVGTASACAAALYDGLSWSVSDATQASISAAGLIHGIREGHVQVQAQLLVGPSWNRRLLSASADVDITAAALSAIAVSPATATLAAGQQQQMTAVGTYTDGSVVNPLGSGYIWSSSNTAVASIAPTGLVTSKDVDTDTDVTITLVNTATGVTVTSATLTVQPEVLQQLYISGNGSTVAIGTTRTFTVTGRDSLGNSMTSADVGAVQWSSSDTSVATLDASTGVLTAINAGRVTVLAQQQVGDTTVAASVDVLIGDAVLSSIAVYADDDTAAVSVPLGLQHSFHAVGTYSDGSTINHLGTGFSWTLGTATGSAAGVIDANGQLTLSSGAVGNTLAVTVTPSLTGVSVTPATVTVAAAELVQMTIQENGEVIPVCLDGFINCSTDGFTRTLTLTGLGSDGNSTTPSGVIWSVSDSRIAAIDAISGEILGLAAGSVEVTAEQVFSDRTVVATATVLVGDAELQSIEILSAAGEASIEAGVGLQHPLQVKGVYSNLAEVEDLGGIQWSVTSTEASNSAAVNQDGVLSVYAGVSGTTLTVTATHSASGKTADATVTLTDAEPVALTLLETDASLALNTDLTLTLQLQDSAGQTCRITNVGTASACAAALYDGLSWSVSDATQASISAAGLIHGIREGHVQVQAQLLVGPSWNRRLLSASADVDITAAALSAIAVSPATATLAAGQQQQMTAVGTYTDGSVVNPLGSGYIWSSSNTAVASIAPTGLVTSKDVDTDTDVTITLVNTATGVTVTSATLTVQPEVLQQLYISGNGSTVAIGTTRTFTITGRDSLGNSMTSADVGAVQWSSSDSSIASMDASTGVLTAINAGRVYVMATRQVGDVLVYAQVEVLVGDAVLTAIAVKAEDDTAAVTLAKGLQHNFHAVGTYSDGSTINQLGTGFLWTVGTATGSAAGVIDANGRLTLSSGAVGNTLEVSVTPSSSAVSVTPATVTAAAPELVSMVIEQSGAVAPVCLQERADCISNGSKLSLTLSGTDSSGAAVTPSAVVWSLSDTGLASIDASSGVLVGLAEGAVEVTAEKTFTDRTVVARATVLIGSAGLQSIEIVSAVGESTLEAGLGMQHALQVKGFYSNQAEVEGLTGIAWSVSSTEAGNSAAVNQDGILTVYAGVAGTTLTVTATHSDSGKSADATVTLTDAEPVALVFKEATSVLGVGASTTLTLSLTDSLGQTCLITNVGSGTACTASLYSGLGWSVSDSSVATIDQAGLLEGVEAGTVSARAELLTGPSWNRRLLTATATVIVGDADLTGISLSPSSTTIAVGTQAQLAVSGDYSNGLTLDLATTDVYWSVEPLPTGAAVTVTPTGLVQVTTAPDIGVADPTITIKATSRTDSSLTATMTFTASAEELVQMTIQQAGDSVAVANTLTMTVAGVDSLGNAATVAMLSGVTWSVSDTTIARIDASSGVLTGVIEGVVTVYAEQDSGGYAGLVVAEADILVGAASIDSLRIETPTQSAVAEGLQLQLEVTAVYSNGVELPISSDLSWSIVSKPDAADSVTLSSTGLLTLNSVSCAGVAGCEVEVKATHADGAESQTLAVTVAATELVTLALKEQGRVVALGDTLGFTLFSTLATGVDAGLTASDVVWSVADTSLATVSQSGVLTANGSTEGSVQVRVSKVVGQSTRLRTVTATATVLIGSATMTAMTVTTDTGASSASVAVGDQQQFEVTATYSNGASIDNLLEGYSWTSTSVVGSASLAISADGIVLVNSGSSGDQSEISVTPDDPSVTVTPATLTIP
jgi:trimeric autotransporter adhesin